MPINYSHGLYSRETLRWQQSKSSSSSSGDSSTIALPRVAVAGHCQQLYLIIISMARYIYSIYNFKTHAWSYRFLRSNMIKPFVFKGQIMLAPKSNFQPLDHTHVFDFLTSIHCPQTATLVWWCKWVHGVWSELALPARLRHRPLHQCLWSRPWLQSQHLASTGGWLLDIVCLGV